ncbi:MAG: hypothetical protein EBW14_16590, partial [Oxalobacteraceae bacterium]|nr:hypothetical protein [Oxalobacteraceae bacterium]
ILSSGIAPTVKLRAAGVHVGLGVDGSSSADSASLWLEARQAMLLAKLSSGAAAGTARMALEMATRGGAGCLGRQGEIGELSVGSVGDIVVWSLDGPQFAGVIDDPIERRQRLQTHQVVERVGGEGGGAHCRRGRRRSGSGGAFARWWVWASA